jgi:hypothetical protein
LDEVIERLNRQREILFDVGRKYARDFENDNLKFTEALRLYCLLRNIGKVTALEDLPLDEKQEMWAFIKEVCGEKRTDRELCRQMMMAFYAL